MEEGDQLLKYSGDAVETIKSEVVDNEKNPEQCPESQTSIQSESSGSHIDEIDSASGLDLKSSHQNSARVIEDSSQREPLPAIPCLPNPVSKGADWSGGRGAGSGWGSWAASLLTNALQLDEEDDDAAPIISTKEGGGIVSAQPEVALPTNRTRIERGDSGVSAGSEDNSPDHGSSDDTAGYGQYLSGLSGWGSGWMSGAINSAKLQSATAAEFLKRDLNEFANVVKKDTAVLANSTTKTLQTTLNVSDESVGKFKGDMSSLLGSVKSTLYTTTSQLYQMQGEEEENIHNRNSSTRNKLKSGAAPGVASAENTLEGKLEALYRDPTTYTTPPTDSEAFAEFTSTFNADVLKSEISSLLVTHTEMRLLYAQLVPSQVSHVDFWSRLWFRRHTVESEAERKTELLSKVHTSLHGDLLDWGDDDEDEEEEEEEDNKAKDKGEQPQKDISQSEADEQSDASGQLSEDQQQMQSSSLSVHIHHTAADDTVESPPDSCTSDEWEKDFEDCRS